MLRAATGGAMQRALVERARNGDLDAFSQLAKAAFPRLGGVAYLILRDPDRAQDAVQDALLMAWRDLRALRDPDSWEAWLQRLTVRPCHKAARRFASTSGWLTGADAYEGLSAYVVWSFPGDGTFHGHITAEGAPPAPLPPARQRQRGPTV